MNVPNSRLGAIFYKNMNPPFKQPISLLGRYTKYIPPIIQKHICRNWLIAALRITCMSNIRNNKPWYVNVLECLYNCKKENKERAVNWNRKNSVIFIWRSNWKIEYVLCHIWYKKGETVNNNHIFACLWKEMQKK